MTKPRDLTATVNDAAVRPNAVTKCPWGAGTVHALIPLKGVLKRVRGDLLNKRSVDKQ